MFSISHLITSSSSHRSLGFVSGKRCCCGSVGRFTLLYIRFTAVAVGRRAGGLRRSHPLLLGLRCQIFGGALSSHQRSAAAHPPMGRLRRRERCPPPVLRFGCRPLLLLRLLELWGSVSTALLPFRRSGDRPTVFFPSLSFLGFFPSVGNIPRGALSARGTLRAIFILFLFPLMLFFSASGQPLRLLPSFVPFFIIFRCVEVIVRLFAPLLRDLLQRYSQRVVVPHEAGALGGRQQRSVQEEAEAGPAAEAEAVADDAEQVRLWSPPGSCGGTCRSAARRTSSGGCTTPTAAPEASPSCRSSSGCREVRDLQAVDLGTLKRLVH